MPIDRASVSPTATRYEQIFTATPSSGRGNDLWSEGSPRVDALLPLRRAGALIEAVSSGFVCGLAATLCLSPRSSSSSGISGSAVWPMLDHESLARSLTRDAQQLHRLCNLLALLSGQRDRRTVAGPAPRWVLGCRRRRSRRGRCACALLQLSHEGPVGRNSSCLALVSEEVRAASETTM